MDINTPITTPARRITRDVRATPTSLRGHYDADGHALTHTPTPGWPTDLPDTAAYSVIGDPRYTQRQAQDMIDAYAADNFDQYLSDLAYARELAAEMAR